MKIIEEHNLGDQVFCDWTCGKEYTDSKEVGGITFGSKAVCPKCAPECEAGAKKHGEEKYIGHRAAPGQTFRDFVVITLREGKPGKITLSQF